MGGPQQDLSNKCATQRPLQVAWEVLSPCWTVIDLHPWPIVGLMLEHGFRVHADRRVKGASQAAPAAEWNGKFANEWVFDFRRWGT